MAAYNSVRDYCRDSQFKRSARLSQERMKEYVKNKELGLALVEAETAAHKLDMANKYRTVGDKLHLISKQWVHFNIIDRYFAKVRTANTI